MVCCCSLFDRIFFACSIGKTFPFPFLSLLRTGEKVKYNDKHLFSRLCRSQFSADHIEQTHLSPFLLPRFLFVFRLFRAFTNPRHGQKIRISQERKIEAAEIHTNHYLMANIVPGGESFPPEYDNLSHGCPSSRTWMRVRT